MEKGLLEGQKEEFFCVSEDEMNDVVQRVLNFLKPGSVLFLHGDLGAGKTTFARMLLRDLGFTGRVKSPTFTLVEPYDLEATRGLFLYHYDLYRMSPDSPCDLESLGIRDQLAQHAVLVF